MRRQRLFPWSVASWLAVFMSALVVWPFISFNYFAGYCQQNTDILRSYLRQVLPLCINRMLGHRDVDMLNCSKAWNIMIMLKTWGRENIVTTLADGIFEYRFVSGNSLISFKIWLLKFVSKGSINNIPDLVEVVACQPLSERMMVSLLRHICVTRLQWISR